MQKSDFAFFHPLRVRWAEVDMQKVVFNGNYMLYCDVAFTEYWRATGLKNSTEQAKEGIELFLRKATIDYAASAEYDDLLDIGVRCSRLGRSSMAMTVGLFRGEDFLVGAELTYVYADVQAKKGVPIPDAWRDRLHTLEHLPPAA